MPWLVWKSLDVDDAFYPVLERLEQAIREDFHPETITFDPGKGQLGLPSPVTMDDERTVER